MMPGAISNVAAFPHANALSDFSGFSAFSASGEARLQHILHNLPSGVILLDSRGRVAEANQLAISMLGEPLLGQRWLDVINRCFRPRSDDGMEVSLADGRRVKIAISALAPEPGQLIVLTDLTETRELQNKLNHLQRLSTLGRMMATLAHQIRTPLSSALLYAENLQNTQVNGATRVQFQQKLIDRLHDLEQQVNDMLLFARSGTAQAVSTLSLQALIGELKSRSEALLLQHNAQLHIELQTPHIEMLGNKNSLVEALLNLLQNSLQATGQGACIRISQHLTASTQTEQNVVLRFCDNGPGIPVDIQPYIFEPFYSRKAGGSGLGLAVVQAVMHSHQGQVRYVDLSHQQPSSGACFELMLPLQLTTNTTEQEELSYV